MHWDATLSHLTEDRGRCEGNAWPNSLSRGPLQETVHDRRLLYHPIFHTDDRRPRSPVMTTQTPVNLGFCARINIIKVVYPCIQFEKRCWKETISQCGRGAVDHSRPRSGEDHLLFGPGLLWRVCPRYHQSTRTAPPRCFPPLRQSGRSSFA